MNIFFIWLVISFFTISIFNFILNIVVLDILLNIRVDCELEEGQPPLRVSLLDLVLLHYRGFLVLVKEYLDNGIILQVDLVAWIFDLDLHIGLSEEPNKWKYLVKLLFLLYILPQRWLLEKIQDLLE